MNAPWWFSDDGSGRFDPVGTGFGACYFGEAQLGAWIEVFRKRMLIAEDDVHVRALQTVEIGRDVKLADLTSRRALAHGATASIGAGEDYAKSHAFARDVLAAGYGGVRYLVRHDPAQKLYGVAIFGPAGAPALDDPDWPIGDDRAIPPALVAEARRVFDYKVVPTP